MPRRKKQCNSIKCKVVNYIKEKRRLKKIEYDAYVKEREKKKRQADAIKRKENAMKAKERGRMKAVKKSTPRRTPTRSVQPKLQYPTVTDRVYNVLKPTNVKTGINMSLSDDVEKKAIRNKTVLKTNTNPVMTQPDAYIQVNTVKSAGVNKYPVTWKTASSGKYNRLWFNTLQEAEQFASMKSREMRIRVSLINNELQARGR